MFEKIEQTDIEKHRRKWLQGGMCALVWVAMPVKPVPALAETERVGALGELIPTDAAGSLTVKVNGQPVSMASWVSELSPQQAVALWRERFRRLSPVLTRHGPWWLTGAPFGDHWLGLQVRAAGQGSVGWQVAMPLAAGSISSDRPMPGWPRDVPLAGSFESRADGRITLTQSGRGFGEVSRLAATISKSMQFEGFQVDGSLDRAVQQGRAAEGQRVLRFVKPGQAASGLVRGAGSGQGDQRQDEALAILVPERSGVLLVIHQIRYHAR